MDYSVSSAITAMPLRLAFYYRRFGAPSIQNSKISPDSEYMLLENVAKKAMKGCERL